MADYSVLGGDTPEAPIARTIQRKGHGVALVGDAANPGDTVSAVVAEAV